MKIERELSRQEIRTLDKRLKEIRQRQKRLTRFVILWTATCLLAGIIIATLIDPKLLSLLTTTVFAFAGIGLWTFLQERRKEQKRIHEIEYLRAVNHVTSIKVQSREFYELSEEEDEGVYYLFQITPEKVLSFGGQDFYPNKHFPSSDFEIVQGKGRDGQIILLEAYSSGDRIQPLKTISGKEKWDLLARINLEDVQIIDGRLEQIA